MGARSEFVRDPNVYTWAIITNSLSKDPGGLGDDLDRTMMPALGSSLKGSPSDLYAEYPSPELPPRDK